MKPKGINWAEIAPKYAALGRGNAEGKKALAKAYGIDSVGAMITGLSAWRKKRTGTPTGPAQGLQNSGEPLGTDKVPKNSSAPIGTPEPRENSPALMGTAEVPTPLPTDMYEQFMAIVSTQGELLALVNAQVGKQAATLRDVVERLSALEPLVKAQQRSLAAVPARAYSKVTSAFPSWAQNLVGIPGYPQDGGRDSRLNIHLPEEERWLMTAIAEGLGENISFVVRRIFATWVETEEARKGLGHYLERRGIAEGTL